MANPRIILIDTAETCWDKPELIRSNTSEVIEIACVEIDADAAAIARKKSYFCLPEISRISYFSFNKYGVTNTRLKEEGVSLQVALDNLQRDFKTLGCILAAWDMGEIDVLENAARSKGRVAPFFRSRIAVRDLLALFTGSNLEIEESLGLFGLKFDGRRHDSMADASNAAAIFIEILKKVREK
jgi:inhibitor of KinA sporulation pathway (predicted exonuclease)